MKKKNDMDIIIIIITMLQAMIYNMYIVEGGNVQQ